MHVFTDTDTSTPSTTPTTTTSRSTSPPCRSDADCGTTTHLCLQGHCKDPCLDACGTLLCSASRGSHGQVKIMCINRAKTHPPTTTPSQDVGKTLRPKGSLPPPLPTSSPRVPSSSQTQFTLPPIFTPTTPSAIPLTSVQTPPAHQTKPPVVIKHPLTTTESVMTITTPQTTISKTPNTPFIIDKPITSPKSTQSSQSPPTTFRSPLQTLPPTIALPKTNTFRPFIPSTTQIPSVPKTLSPVGKQCTSSLECPRNLACLKKQCTDPCKMTSPCGSGFVCQVVSHRLTCQCPTGSTLDSQCPQGNLPSAPTPLPPPVEL